MNYPTTESEQGEKLVDPKHVFQYMKKEIKTRATMTPLDMKLIKNVLFDDRKPWP